MRQLGNRAVAVLLASFFPFASVARGDQPKKSSDQTNSTPAEAVRLLRAKVKMLESTVRAKNERIRKLEAETKKMAAELERVRTLCRKANLDVDEPAPSGEAAEKPKGAPRRSLAWFLRSMPERFGLPNPTPARDPPLTELQWKDLNAWCARSWSGKVVTAKLLVTTVKSENSKIIVVSGWFVRPPKGNERAIVQCRVRAEFPAADRSKLLAIKKGGTISVVGKVQKPAGERYFSPANWGRCAISLADCKLLPKASVGTSQPGQKAPRAEKGSPTGTPALRQTCTYLGRRRTHQWFGKMHGYFADKIILLDGKYKDIGKHLVDGWPDLTPGCRIGTCGYSRECQVLQVVDDDELLVHRYGRAASRDRFTVIPAVSRLLFHVKRVKTQGLVEGAAFEERLVCVGTYRYTAPGGAARTVPSYVVHAPLTKEQFADALAGGFKLVAHRRIARVWMGQPPGRIVSEPVGLDGVFPHWAKRGLMRMAP